MSKENIILTINGTDIPNPDSINDYKELYNYIRIIESWKKYLKNCKRVSNNNDLLLAEIKTINDICQLYKVRSKNMIKRKYIE